MRSESIAELAKALAKAQGEMKGALRDSQNPYFKSTYADLASVWDAIKEPFTKNGLSFVQAVTFDPQFPDHVFVDTTMLHTSGEYIGGRIGMKPVKSDPQSVGSCITYCRRYGLQALSGVAPEDDDGNAASGKFEKPVVKDVVPSHLKREQPDDVPEPEQLSDKTEKPKTVTLTQKKILSGLMDKDNIPKSEQKEVYAFGMCGYDTYEQAQKFIEQYGVVLKAYRDSKEAK